MRSRRALLRCEDAHGVDQRHVHVAGDAGRRRQPVDDLEQSGAGVDVRSPPEPDVQVRGPAERKDQLPEAARRRGDRIEPMRVEWNRLGRLDRGLPGRKLEPARAPRAAEGVVHLRLPPLRGKHGLQHVERALATVGDGQLVDVRPPP